MNSMINKGFKASPPFTLLQICVESLLNHKGLDEWRMRRWKINVLKYNNSAAVLP